MNEQADSGPLKAASRWTAWIAFATIVLFIVTGYGMGKRIMDPALAKWLHVKILPIPLFISLVAHGGICARATMRRLNVFRSDSAASLYVAICCLVLLGLFAWLYAG